MSGTVGKGSYVTLGVSVSSWTTNTVIELGAEEIHLRRGRESGECL